MDGRSNRTAATLLADRNGGWPHPGTHLPRSQDPRASSGPDCASRRDMPTPACGGQPDACRAPGCGEGAPHVRRVLDNLKTFSPHVAPLSPALTTTATPIFATSARASLIVLLLARTPSR